MAQNYAFLSYGPTLIAAVGGALGIATVTVSGSTTGIPASALRLWNSGTGMAYIMIGTATALTVTGALANGMPVPQSVAPFVLRTGGSVYLQTGTTGTVTTSIYVTAGEGID